MPFIICDQHRVILQGLQIQYIVQMNFYLVVAVFDKYGFTAKGGLRGPEWGRAGWGWAEW